MDSPHLRIAVTTNSLLKLDAAFIAAKQVVFYDVTRDSSEFVDVVPFNRLGQKAKGPGGGKGCSMEEMDDDDGTGRDPLVERVNALKGCSILFTLGLSDLAAVRVHAEKVFPVKSERIREIDDVIDHVQKLLIGRPPLWVRRVMRGPDGQRMMTLDEQEA